MGEGKGSKTTRNDKEEEERAYWVVVFRLPHESQLHDARPEIDYQQDPAPTTTTKQKKTKKEKKTDEKKVKLW